MFPELAAVQDGVVGVLGPWSHGTVGHGIAHGIIGAEEVVGRVEQVVFAIALDHRGPFEDGVRGEGACVLPRLRSGEAPS